MTLIAAVLTNRPEGGTLVAVITAGGMVEYKLFEVRRDDGTKIYTVKRFHYHDASHDAKLTWDCSHSCTTAALAWEWIGKDSSIVS